MSGGVYDFKIQILIFIRSFKSNNISVANCFVVKSVWLAVGHKGGKICVGIKQYLELLTVTNYLGIWKYIYIFLGIMCVVKMSVGKYNVLNRKFFRFYKA